MASSSTGAGPPRAARGGSSSRPLSGGVPPPVPKLALPPSSSRGASSAGAPRHRESSSARPGSSRTPAQHQPCTSPAPPHQPSTARPATSSGVQGQRPSAGRVLLAGRPATASHAPAGGQGGLHQRQPQGARQGSFDAHALDSARPWTSRTDKSTARSIITGKIRRDIKAPSERDNRVSVQPDPRWKGLYSQAKKEMKEAADLDREYEKAMLGYSGKKVSRARLDFNLFCLEKQGVIPPPPPEPDHHLWLVTPEGGSSIASSEPEPDQFDAGRGRRTAR